MVAVIGLLDAMRADGRLAGTRDDWTLEQLADRFMDVSRTTAGELLEWLKESGALVVTYPRRDDGRRETPVRLLVVPTRPILHDQRHDQKLATGPRPMPLGEIGRGDHDQKTASRDQFSRVELVPSGETPVKTLTRATASRSPRTSEPHNVSGADGSPHAVKAQAELADSGSALTAARVGTTVRSRGLPPLEPRRNRTSAVDREANGLGVIGNGLLENDRFPRKKNRVARRK